MATKRVCSITNCGKPYCAKGYCKRHYARFVSKTIRPRTFYSEMPGRRFGRLVVQRFVSHSVHSGAWVCLCDCGNTRTLYRAQLVRGKVKSCGCLRKTQLQKHGCSGTQTYNAWQAMKRRCTNPKVVNYRHYGGRGIRVCPEWFNSFETFLADMGEVPEGKSLDRIDVNGNYEPGNCRWATGEEQVANRRCSVPMASYVEIKRLADAGMSKKEIALKLGLPRTTVGNRLARARMLANYHPQFMRLSTG